MATDHFSLRLFKGEGSYYNMYNKEIKQISSEIECRSIGLKSVRKVETIESGDKKLLENNIQCAL